MWKTLGMVLAILLWQMRGAGRVLAEENLAPSEAGTAGERSAGAEREASRGPSGVAPATAVRLVDEGARGAARERPATLELSGGAILYDQGSRAGLLEGAGARSPGRTGLTADLELTARPALPLGGSGELYVRVHAGRGVGADADATPGVPAGGLLANLNTLADDNHDGRGDTEVRLLEAIYSHTLVDGRLAISVGHSEAWRFLDQNEYANGETRQFVGKPFVNNTVMDGENEYAPILSVTVAPAESIAITVLGASSTRTLVDGTPLALTAKGAYERMLSTPFVAAQATVSPRPGGRPGHYRLFAWSTGYEHSRLDGRREPVAGEAGRGRGIGLSADQEISGKLGVFCRIGLNDEDVYVVRWEASAGVSLRGLVAGRDEDNLGVGLATLVPGSRYERHDPEYHLEAFYRHALTESLAISPDVQLVWNSGGDRENGLVFAAMVRAELAF